MQLIQIPENTNHKKTKLFIQGRFITYLQLICCKYRTLVLIGSIDILIIKQSKAVRALFYKHILLFPDDFSFSHRFNSIVYKRYNELV